jgi:hypothetical protein
MQGIYNYVLETNHVSRVYSVAAILHLQLMLHVMFFPTLNVLYFRISTFLKRECSGQYGCFFAVPLFRSFPLLMYFLSGFQMVPVARIVTVIIVFTFHTLRGICV